LPWDQAVISRSLWLSVASDGLFVVVSEMILPEESVIVVVTEPSAFVVVVVSSAEEEGVVFELCFAAVP